eukprot:461611-Amorphochlora_amoeboformis.AAC.1
MSGELGAAFFNLAQIRRCRQEYPKAIKTLRLARRHGYDFDFDLMNQTLTELSKKKKHLETLRRRSDANIGKRERAMLLGEMADLCGELGDADEEAIVCIDIAKIVEDEGDSGDQGKGLGDRKKRLRIA